MKQKAILAAKKIWQKPWPISKKKLNFTCRNEAWLFLAPSLIGVSIFVLIPFVDVIRRSFFSSLGGGFTGLTSYKDVLQNQAFQLAAGNTAKFILVCIPLLVVLALLLALFLNTKKKDPTFWKASFLLPMAIPAASMVLIWQLFFHEKGLINHALTAIGGSGIDFMNTNLAFSVLVGSYLWKNMGYDMVLWLAGLSNIPKDLYEAAAIDGAGGLKRFLYITLPNLTGVLFTIVVLSLLNSFKVFREAYLVAGDHPHSSMYLLQHLFNNWFSAMEIDKLCAGAVMMAVVILGLVLLLQKAWGSKDA